MAERPIPPRIARFVLFATTLLLSRLRPALAATICYGIDGSQNTALPCDPDDPAGPCCSFGDICLSNGLCSPGPNVVNHGFTNYYRPAGCTDPLWNSTSCFNGCNEFGGNGLQSCNAGKFCCYNFNGCSCSSTSLFSLGTARFLTTLPLSPPTSTPTPSSTPVSTSAVTTPPSSSTSLSSSHTTPLANKPTTTDEPATEKSNSTALGAGIGIGLGVPIVALSIILYIVIKRSRSPPQIAPSYQAAPQAPRHEMETPYVIHEAPSSHKFAHQGPTTQELDAQGTTYAQGGGWHR